MGCLLRTKSGPLPLSDKYSAVLPCYSSLIIPIAPFEKRVMRCIYVEMVTGLEFELLPFRVFGLARAAISLPDGLSGQGSQPSDL